VVWLTSIEVFRARMPERLRRPFLHAKPIFIVLAVWTIVAFTAFNLLVPAASYFHSRLSLILLVPSLLFGAMLFTALVRVITHHHSPLLASTLFVLLLGSTGKVMLWWPPFQDGTPPLFDVVEHLQAARITPQTRLYGDTGTALQLAFYTGLPVQSVLPIRRTFLDTYPGEVVVIEGPALSRLSGPEVRQQLAAEGVVIGDREAWRLARRVNDHHMQDGLRDRGVHLCPALAPEEAPITALKPLQLQKTRREVVEMIADNGNPMFKGFRMDTFTEIWQVFFYRFVNPGARMGANVNYASRMRGATATILRGGWVVLRSRPPGSNEC
jgi:hypothetical protein